MGLRHKGGGYSHQARPGQTLPPTCCLSLSISIGSCPNTPAELVVAG